MNRMAKTEALSRGLPTSATGDGAADRSAFLESSKFDGDKGENVGLDPRKIPKSVLRVLGHPETPLKSIRGKCLDCSNGVPSEVRKCVAVHCPLWPFRMGSNPFHALAGKAD